MGTLDDEAASPNVAVSGSGPGKASALLTELGFHVDAVAECGDAAVLELARSLFMKSLKAPASCRRRA
jgi:hypothetical protein